MTIQEIRCTGCGKKLLTYDATSFRRYKSPVRQCKKCGTLWADPRCHEIAIEGIPADTFSVKSYSVLIIIGALVLWRGIHLFGMHQLGTPEETQWLLPALISAMGVIFILWGILEIILIKTGRKQERFARMRLASEERMCNRQYVETLRQLGYPIPEKYNQM